MSAPRAERNDLCFAGGFSIDAILFADGSYDTDRLGGNALWAAAGAMLNGAEPRAFSVVGADYPPDALDRLDALGIDVTGVRRDEGRAGVRVTYSYREDGSRVQPASAAALQVVPEPHRSRFIDTTRSTTSPPPQVTPADLPADSTGTCWHLGLLPIEVFHDLAAHLRGTGARYLQADCPARYQLRLEGIDSLAPSLELLDVFLPSTSDTDVFLPGLGRPEIIAAFQRLGARNVVLKCGEDGALVALDDGSTWHIPAVRDPLEIDPTGSGDVFAGAFAATVQAGGDYIAAACRGAATASVATRLRNPLQFDEIDPRDVDRNTATIAEGVTRV
ncbi:MAG: carbohydrate kinase family protein [Protaetiibacter sp.]